MKFFESSFHEYIQEVERINIHNYKKNEIDKIVNNKALKELNDIILFGAKGIGKYSQALNIIKYFSPSKLKYEKKFNILFQNKYDLNFKISDIHYEIDMNLLGCNAKLLWHEFYNHIVDIIYTKHKKEGIILCKNFHNINWELLEVFYKYMNIYNKNINIKFIIITENVGFINEYIMNKCLLISLKTPTKKNYISILKEHNDVKNKNLSLTNITNIKNLKSKLCNSSNINFSIYNDIYNIITNYQKLNFLELREKLYHLLIYDISVEETLWYLLKKLYQDNYIKYENLLDIHNNINIFTKLYTNNYRPIFHLERIVLYLCKVINEL